MSKSGIKRNQLIRLSALTTIGKRIRGYSIFLPFLHVSVGIKSYIGQSCTFQGISLDLLLLNEYRANSLEFSNSSCSPHSTSHQKSFRFPSKKSKKKVFNFQLRKLELWIQVCSAGTVTVHLYLVFPLRPNQTKIAYNRQRAGKIISAPLPFLVPYQSEKTAGKIITDLSTIFAQTVSIINSYHSSDVFLHSTFIPCEIWQFILDMYRPVSVTLFLRLKKGFYFFLFKILVQTHVDSIYFFSLEHTHLNILY